MQEKFFFIEKFWPINEDRMIDYHHFETPDNIMDLTNDHQMAAIAFEWKTDGNFIKDESNT